MSPARPAAAVTGETWLVLGGSSSLGRAFAFEVARRGHDVLLAGRDMEDLERTAGDLRVRTGRRVEALHFDALAWEHHAVFARTCRERARHLNVFLTFAAMPPNAAAERDVALAMQTVEATYTGAASVLLHLAPILEAQKGGRVIVVGSVAGERGRAKNYIYGSAKAGLHTFTEGLRARLWRAGVTVTLVKPGYLDTAMTWGQGGHFLVATPEDCAAACLRAAVKGRPVIYFPWFWRWIMLLIRAIPPGMLKKMKF